MSMQHLEIPYVEERGKRYRFFEILPGLLSWGILLLPLILSFINPTVTVIFIIAYMLMWMAKAIGLYLRAIQGYGMIRKHMKLPWSQMLDELETLKAGQPDRHVPTWHYDNLRRLQEEPALVKPSEVVHAVIIATYNEARDVLEPTIQAVMKSQFDMQRVILVLAYEERGGPETEKNAEELINDYKKHFRHAMAVKHPKDIPGEVVGKGGNITYAAKELAKYLDKIKLEPVDVVVTTLDSDNRPHPMYLSALTYLYAVCPDPVRISFQPIPMFTNNIWDAPAPMRVIATGNSFWMTVTSMRPHMLRNFSAHAQSMQALIDTDYWSVRTIVEDGHQFWRSYFRYEGRHEVYPIFLPIYQDAVLSNTYAKTLKAQFVQLRRWAWGASDIAYVAEKGFFRPNKVPKLDLVFKFLRLLEGHVSWATAPLILALAAFIPARIDPENFAANQLPLIASRIQTIALIGIVFTLFFSLKTLPPKPRRYKSHRSLFMILQWVYLPLTTIVYSSFSALYSQTRLMLGRYLGKFDVTDKAVVREDKSRVMRR